MYRNEKVICAALAILANEPNLSSEKMEIIFDKFVAKEYKGTINNASWLNAAMIFASHGYKDKAFTLLKQVIKNPNDDFSKEPAILAAVELFGKESRYSELYYNSENHRDMSIANRIAFIYGTRQIELTKRMSSAFRIEEAIGKKWIPEWTNPFKKTPCFAESFRITIPKEYSINIGEIHVYKEEITKVNNTDYRKNVQEYELVHKNAKTKGDIIDDLSCLENNGNLFSVIFERSTDDYYYADPSFNPNSNLDGGKLKDKDKKKVSEYLAENSCKENGRVVIKAKIKDNNEKTQSVNVRAKNGKTAYKIDLHYFGKGKEPKYSAWKSIDKEHPSSLKVVLEGQSRIELTYIIKKKGESYGTALYSIRKDKNETYIIK